MNELESKSQLPTTVTRGDGAGQSRASFRLKIKNPLSIWGEAYFALPRRMASSGLSATAPTTADVAAEEFWYSVDDAKVELFPSDWGLIGRNACLGRWSG